MDSLCYEFRFSAYMVVHGFLLIADWHSVVTLVLLVAYCYRKGSDFFFWDAGSWVL